tara:strand:+ start:8026 stop:8736 length:711 start_codon:yes stop_codon:yes gene_type:complete
MSIFLQRKINMIVCDMAGTIVNEKGLIYKSIFNTLKISGYAATSQMMDSWPGKDKKDVLRNVVYQHIGNYKRADEMASELENELMKTLEKEYFKKGNIELIDDNLLDFFDCVRINGIKVCLNTGYPKKLQEKIIDKFNLYGRIDSFISSEEVVCGRPAPYMIHRLMEDNLIMSANSVAKIGDTQTDMLEGVNAKCGLVIGVLSGHEKKDNLLGAGADVVVNKITDLDSEVYCDFYL